MACAENRFSPRKIGNQRATVLSFLKELPAGSRLGVESTSSYHELLATLAYKRGFVVYILNPKDTHHYAKAMGLRGKTDRVDAQLIARMIAHEHAKLHPWIPPTPEQRQMDQLIKRRATLSRIRAALTQSLKDLEGLGPEIKALRQRPDKLIVAMDARVISLMEASPVHKQDYARLQTIQGVGPVVGASLANTLERVPLRSADAFVAFTGLDPRPDESREHRGRRRLSKRGPSELRRLLYLAAMAAAKTKPWKPLYESTRARVVSPALSGIYFISLQSTLARVVSPPLRP